MALAIPYQTRIDSRRGGRRPHIALLLFGVGAGLNGLAIIPFLVASYVYVHSELGFDGMLAAGGLLVCLAFGLLAGLSAGIAYLLAGGKLLLCITVSVSVLLCVLVTIELAVVPDHGIGDIWHWLAGLLLR